MEETEYSIILTRTSIHDESSFQSADLTHVKRKTAGGAAAAKNGDDQAKAQEVKKQGTLLSVIFFSLSSPQTFLKIEFFYF